MIIVRLRGGLGNQLFQYAAGRALAHHHNTSLKFDLYYYTKHPYRKYELDRFAFPVELATRKEVHRFTGSNPVIRFVNKRENYLRCPQVFVQPHYHFYEDFFRLPAPLYISGYYQSEKYFLHVRNEIASQFQLAAPLDDVNQKLANEMMDSNSVSVHVRRGDYKKGVYNSFFGGLTPEYYRAAIKKIKQQVDQPRFFVFSDDMIWCKENIQVEDATYVDHNKGSDSYKDLYLMTRCKHNVMANSSFSWWGGWLNTNPGKVIICPQKWFQQEYVTNPEVIYPCRIYNTKDLIPSGWNRI